jgi:DNA-binding FadR family transcriptional regulator
MADILRPIEPLESTATVSQLAQERIKEYILVNRLRAGMVLPPETHLARQLGISRNSVREAVKALVALGIVEVRHGSGLFVGAFAFRKLLAHLSYGVQFEVHELSEFLEIRRVLETGMIDVAMAHMTDDQLRRLQELVAQMERNANAGLSIREIDQVFHKTLFENIHNRPLIRLLDSFWLITSKVMEFADLGKPPDPLPNYHLHAAIFDAVIARDVPRARDALDRHYADVTDRLTRFKQAEQTGETASHRVNGQ